MRRPPLLSRYSLLAWIVVGTFAVTLWMLS